MALGTWQFNVAIKAGLRAVNIEAGLLGPSGG